MNTHLTALVGYIALAVTALLLFVALSVRDNSIDACERSNEVRGILAESLRDQNQRSRETDPDLFPDIPRAEFERLLREGIEARRESIRQLRTVDCDEEFPVLGL